MVDMLFYVFFNGIYLYQDDNRVIRNGSMHWNPFKGEKDCRLERVSNPEPLEQQASA